MEASDLVGVRDVAALIGVKPETVHTYVHRGIMPAPLLRISGSPVWDRGVIEAWHRTRPRPGRQLGWRKNPAQTQE